MRIKEKQSSEVTTQKMAHIKGWVCFNFRVLAKPACLFLPASTHSPSILKKKRGSQAKTKQNKTSLKKNQKIGVPIVAQWKQNLTSIHEDAGSIPVPHSVG